MVKVEGRVTRTGEDIIAGVAAEGVVAASVNADLERRLVLSMSGCYSPQHCTYIAATRYTLHSHLEVVYVLRLGDQRQHRRSVGIALVDLINQVSLEASGIIVQCVTSESDHFEDFFDSKDGTLLNTQTTAQQIGYKTKKYGCCNSELIIAEHLN